MKRPPSGARSARHTTAGPARIGAPLALFALASCACIEDDGAWTFSVSRGMYSFFSLDFDETDHPNAHVHANSDRANSSSTEAVWVFGALFLLPVAIDLVALPVTFTHDCVRYGM